MTTDKDSPDLELIELLARLIARRHVNRHRSAANATSKVSDHPATPDLSKPDARQTQDLRSEDLKSS